MKRDVVAVSFEELRRQFKANPRHDVKPIVPKMASESECERLRTSTGRPIESECVLPGRQWMHTPSGTPNYVCESADFSRDVVGPSSVGPLALSAADEQADQGKKLHIHCGHAEIFISTYPIRAEYRSADRKLELLDLPEGGVMVFAQGVPHRVLLGGLTLIVETPAVLDDKQVVDWEPDEHSVLASGHREGEK